MAFAPFPELCAVAGCGGIVSRHSIYCDDCVASLPITRFTDSVARSDHDIPLELLREAREGKHKLKGRLRRFGAGKCPCGGDTFPGRLYCSDRCRGGQAIATVELDGIVATPYQHARRIGMPRGTMIARMRRGMSPLEALTAPVDERGRALRAGSYSMRGKREMTTKRAQLPAAETT